MARYASTRSRTQGPLLALVVAIAAMVCAFSASVAAASARIRPETVTMSSTVLGTKVSFYVYMPPAPVAGKRYPVTYLVHGYPGSYTTFDQWTNLSHVLTKHEVIAVLPDGAGTGFFVDSPLDPQYQYATFLTKELVPYIDAHYPTIADRQSRAIGGFSMGGHAAMTLAMKHPDLFGSVTSVSACMDLSYLRGDAQLSSLLGPYETATSVWNANSAIELARAGRVPPNLAINIIVGSQDPLLQMNRAFNDVLLAAGVPHSYHEYPGAHTAEFISAHWEDLLSFHDAQFRGAEPLAVPPGEPPTESPKP